jgi:hypothetical protein
VEAAAAQEVAARVVLRVRSGYALAGWLGDLHAGKRGGELVEQVVQGAAAGVAGAEAEDEGGCAAGVVESGPPDGIDPRVVRSPVG